MEDIYQIAIGGDDADRRSRWWRIGTGTGPITKTLVREGMQVEETLVAWVKIHAEDAGEQISDDYYFWPLYTILRGLVEDADSNGRAIWGKTKGTITTGADDADERREE